MYRLNNNSNLYNNNSYNNFYNIPKNYSNNYSQNNKNYFDKFSSYDPHGYNIITGLPKNQNNFNSSNNNLIKKATNINNYYKNDNKYLNNKNNYGVKNTSNFFSDNYNNSRTTISNSQLPYSSQNQKYQNFQNDNNNNKYFDDNNSDLSKIPFLKKGFQNLRNTCFMNTALQILIHNSLFLNDFLKSNVNSNTLISNSFNLILKNYNGDSYSSLSKFYSNFIAKHNEFSNYMQQDCLEFIRKFLEDLNQELNLIKNKPKYIELEQNNKNKITIYNEFDNNFKNREDSIIINNFYGTYINTFICKNCGFESFSFQKFLDLPLLFNNNNNNNNNNYSSNFNRNYNIYNYNSFSYNDSVKIEDMIKTNFNEEEILFNSPCQNSNCKKKSVHLKKTNLCYLPKILILSLQRMRKSRNKINTKVSFSETLNLNNFIDSEICNNNYQYQLYAIANHKGTIDFGHYYANIKIDGNWYEFNDSMVTNCRIENPSSNAYILFYIRNG
jgi:ubiquitin C-terminal hydrolase